MPKKKCLVGWTSRDWDMFWSKGYPQDKYSGNLELRFRCEDGMDELFITKTKKGLFSYPKKVRITIEEL